MASEPLNDEETIHTKDSIVTTMMTASIR